MRTVRRSEQAGFTLLEVIVAVTLVSLLLVGVFGCVRLSLDTMQRVDARMVRERRVTSVQEILRSELEGLIPVPADCAAMSDAPPQRIAFFDGEPTTLRFVSTYSLNERDRGMPRILEMQVIPGENGEGVRLVVNESLYSGPRSAGAFCMTGEGAGPRFAPVTVGPNSFVLADKLEHCRFEYRIPPVRNLPVEWVSLWDRPVYPDAIRVDMAPLHAPAGELALEPVIAALRVTRNPLLSYAQNQ